LICLNVNRQVHDDQLDHVQKGCLARPREDICMDGSRIEGSHKAWNSLQRAQPSGLETYTSLAYDSFHRRNIRVGIDRVLNKRPVNFSAFIASTYSSHHIGLVNYTAELFNTLYEKESPASKMNLKVYPTLPRIDVAEMIGLVESTHTVTFGGFIDPKVEASEQDLGDALLEEIDAVLDETGQSRLMATLGVEEHLLSVMMPSVAPDSVPVSTPAIVTSALTGVGAPSTSSVQQMEQVHIADISAPSSPSKKRKEYEDRASEKHIYLDDSTPDSKRKRCAEPLSPNTLALGYSSLEPDVLELNKSPSQTPSQVSLILYQICLNHISTC
jgi:hypothetical protein